MAKKENQKLKLLYLLKIFMYESDEEHPLRLQEIIDKLESCGVSVERKTLYQDFEELRRFGIEIMQDGSGRNSCYYLGERLFELPELKLLIDSVQSSKFISQSKSNQMIQKIEQLTSRYEAKYLQRQVFLSGRVKTMNESIFYNVDKLHDAISADCKIRFQYYSWNIHKKLVPRKGGADYEISPWQLMWDDENYYLVGYETSTNKIKHYRVDKMKAISITDQKRDGREQFESFDLPSYTKAVFGMYGGERTRVTLEGNVSLVGTIIDRFGKDIILIPVGDDRFRTSVEVEVSNQFLGWIIALGGGIKIISPDCVVEKMKTEIRRLQEQYGV